MRTEIQATKLVSLIVLFLIPSPVLFAQGKYGKRPPPTSSKSSSTKAPISSNRQSTTMRVPRSVVPKKPPAKASNSPKKSASLEKLQAGSAKPRSKSNLNLARAKSMLANVTKPTKKASENLTKLARLPEGEKMIVYRAMSLQELANTIQRNELRGGTKGIVDSKSDNVRGNPHFVTTAPNRSLTLARRRLALAKTPQVIVKLEVPRRNFSEDGRAEPRYNMNGGGTELRGRGVVPVRIRGILSTKD